MPTLRRRIRNMIEDAESFIAKLPSDAVGVIFMDGEKPVQPDVNELDKYRRSPGASHGFWPSSSDIARAMLERYNDKPKPVSKIPSTPHEYVARLRDPRKSDSNHSVFVENTG